MQPKSSSGQQASSTASSSSSNSSATEKRDDKQTRGEIENRSQGQASARAEAATAGVVVAVDAPPPPPQLECGAPPATTSTAQRSFGAPARENQFGSCQTGQVNNKGGASEPVVVPTTTTNEEGNKKKEVNKKDEKRSVENGKQPPASAQASAHRGPKVDTGNERQEQLREHQQVSNSSSNNSNEQSTDRRQVEELRQFRLGDYNCANNRSGERWHETCVTQAKVEAAPGTAKTSRQTSCSSLVRGVEEITQTTSVGPPQWGQPPVPLVDTPSPGPSQISGRAAAAEAEAYRSPLARPRPIQQHSGVRQQISCGLVEGIQQKQQQQQQQQQQRPTRTTSADEQVPVSSQGLRLPEQNSRIQRQSSAPTNEQANDEQRGGHQEEDQRQADTWRPPQPLPAGRQQRIKVTLSRPRTESCEQESCEDQEQLRRNHHQHQLEQSSVSGGPCGEHNNNNHHQHRRSSPDTASHLSESSSQVNFVFGQSPRTRGQSTATLISGSIEQIATVVAGEGQQQQIDPSDQTRTVADAAAVAGASDLSAAKRLSDLVASDRPSCAQTGANFKPLRLSRSEQDNQLRRIASERRRVGGARPEPGAGLKTAKAEAGATTTSVVIGQQRQQQLSQKTADPIQTSRPLTLEASDKNNYLPSGPAASSSKQNEALNCTANSKTVSVPRPPPPDTSSLLVKPSNTAAALAANDRVGDEVAAGLGGAAGGLSPTKQLAIYINGKIRSNSIFCSRSASSNSFTGILKSHFYSAATGTGTKTNANTKTCANNSRLVTDGGDTQRKQQQPGEPVVVVGAPDEDRLGGGGKPGFVNCLIPSVCKRTARGAAAGRSRFGCFRTTTKTTTNNRQDAIRSSKQSTSTAASTAPNNSGWLWGWRQRRLGSRLNWLRLTGFDCEQCWPAAGCCGCHCCTSQACQTRLTTTGPNGDEDEQLKVHEEEQEQQHEDHESRIQLDLNERLEGSNQQDQDQEEQPEEPKTYKLNPSSMFLRKAMRYYRLWIYSANLIILLGAIIFVLSALYVTSDYRFQLVVAPNAQVATTRTRTLTTTRTTQDTDGSDGGGGVPVSSTLSSSSLLRDDDNTGPTSANAFELAPELLPPDGGSNADERFSFSIGLSEPVMVLAYLMIAVQLGVLQAIGCFGAIRMKERLIQAFWYLILALILIDVMILVYWLQRYDVILKSLRHEMTARLNLQYGRQDELGEFGVTQSSSSPGSFSIIESIEDRGNNDYSNNNNNKSNTGLSSNDDDDTLASYRRELDKTFTQILDRIQASSKCCGISNSLDYRHSHWRRQKVSQLQGQLKKHHQRQQQQHQDQHYHHDVREENLLLGQLALVPASCCMSPMVAAGKRNIYSDYWKAPSQRASYPPTANQLSATSATVWPSAYPQTDNLSGFKQGGGGASLPQPSQPQAAGDDDEADNDGESRSAIAVAVAAGGGGDDGAGEPNQRRRPTLADVIDRRWSGRGLILEGAQSGSGVQVGGGSDNEDAGQVDGSDDGGDDSELAHPSKRQRPPYSNKRARFVTKQMHYEPVVGELSPTNSNGETTTTTGARLRAKRAALSSEHADEEQKTRTMTKMMMRKTTTNTIGLGTDEQSGENYLLGSDVVVAGSPDTRSYLAHNYELEQDSEEEDGGRRMTSLDVEGPTVSVGPGEIIEFTSQQQQLDGDDDDEDDDDDNDNWPQSSSGGSKAPVVRHDDHQPVWAVESKLDQRGRVLSRLIELIDTNNKTRRQLGQQQHPQQQPEHHHHHHQQQQQQQQSDSGEGKEIQQAQATDSQKLDSAESWRTQLNSLRQLLFVAKFQQNVESQQQNDSAANFIWPNELGLNYRQFKLLESYLNEQIAEAEVETASINNNDVNTEADRKSSTSSKTLRRRSANPTLLSPAPRLQQGHNGQSAESGHVDTKQPAAASGPPDDSTRRSYELIRELVHNDSQLGCLARSYYDKERIYTRGCQPQIKAWLQSSANILFITGFCVLTVLKFCSLILLRLEIREMIHKIRVLRGMATEYNALQDLEPYLPRPSVCAQAAELTPTGVSPALGGTGTGGTGLGSPTGGLPPIGMGMSAGETGGQGAGTAMGNQHTTRTASCGSPTNAGMATPLVPVPRRLGGSFSEAVAAAAAVAHQQRLAEHQQQQLQRHLRDYERAASFANCARAASTKTIMGGGGGGSGCSCAGLSMTSGNILNAPQHSQGLGTGSLCPCSSSMSMAAHLNHSASQLTAAAAAAAAASSHQYHQQQRHQQGVGGGGSSNYFRSEMFPGGLASMPRRHTAISVCPAAAAAAAAAAHHLMMRRGTFAIANAPLTFGNSINSTASSNATSQHQQQQLRYQSSGGGLGGALSAAAACASVARHSSSSMLQAKSLNYLNQHRHSAHAVPPSHMLFRSSGDTSGGHTGAGATNFLLPNNNSDKLSPFRRPSSGLVHEGPAASIGNPAAGGKRPLLASSNQLDPAAESHNPPFKRQVSGGAQSAVNFSLDIAPVQLTESRRSIH